MPIPAGSAVFLLVACLIVVTPGPDMPLVAKNAIGGGRRAAIATALGVETGLLIWTGASALGLAALLEASAFAFTLVKLAGAAYLVYLGLRVLLSVRRQPGQVTNAPRPDSSTERAPIASPFR